MKKLILGAFVMTLVLSLTACSSNTDKADKADNANATRVVTDMKGEVTVPVNPERVVDLSGASDILHILGYNIVGTANSDGYDYTKFPSYLENELKDAKILGYSMSNTFDIEAVMALEPDLIVISAVQEKIYDQLKEIAPTIMVNMAQVDWRTDFMSVAKVMDKETEAKAWIADYDKKAAVVSEKLKKEYGEDSTYLSFLASSGSIFIFDGAGLGSIFYDDLGLKRPENLPKQADVSLPVVTMEGLAEIDADYIFAVGTDEDLVTLESSKIFKKMSAVKNKNTVILPASPYFNIGYSPIGRLVFIEEVESLLSSRND